MQFTCSKILYSILVLGFNVHINKNGFTWLHMFLETRQCIIKKSQKQAFNTGKGVLQSVPELSVVFYP